ncbi:MAG: DUF4160 domain-containing protein [Candidatus Kapabacteria bacterium]|nr:DUF4160 domain-containing protein [Candidatus Kapabacteria bacterium]
MPTLLVIGPYRFYFYSHENDEPPHIHIDRDRSSAKFWLNPVSLAKNIGFNNAELNKINKIIVNNNIKFLDEWYEYFGS